MTLFQALLYFPLYAFLGWCLEVSYQAVSKGIVVNRGFLNGPVCPIYGVGVIGSVLLVETIFGGTLREIPGIAIFAFGTVFSTSIELFGGWLLDKLFHARWWDYRDRRFNLNGYICLEFSLIWGLGMVFVLREIFPFLAKILSFIKPGALSYVLLASVYALFAVDVIVSALIVAGVDKKFREIDELQQRLRHVSDELSAKIGEDTLERKEDVEEILLERKDELEARIIERSERLNTILAKHKIVGAGRVLRAYPGMIHKNSNEILSEMREIVQGNPKY